MTTITSSDHAGRISIHDALPAAYAAQGQFQDTAVELGEQTGLEPLLVELVKIRASQLNGCAFCLDLHNHDARKLGEKQSRLDVVAAWEEAGDRFTPREQAALRLTEAVTLIAGQPVPDDVYEAAAAEFSPEAFSALVIAILAINNWNRIAVLTHTKLPRRND